MTVLPTHAAPRTASIGHTAKSAILVLVLLLTLFASMFLVADGHFSVDEAVYHMMARSFASTGSLSVWNGYEEFPSAELTLPMLRVHDGRLFPQYPHLATILATPFYWLAGYRGLFVLNAFATVGVIGLCFLTARALFRDRDLALNACLILVFGGFAWEYSQAAWPHALSTLFVSAAVYLTVAALLSRCPRRSLGLAVAAGLAVGFGLGVRLDVVFALPAIVLPFVFAIPWRPWHALAACSGTAPGLALLAFTNAQKFGTIAPFSYGIVGSGPASGLVPYLPIVVLGLIVVAAAWLATRPRYQSWLALRRPGVALGLALAVIAVGFTPLGWQLITRFAGGLYQIVVDLRVRDPDLLEPALLRSPSGSMVYIGALKKALLQSCPYLTVLILPLAKRLCDRMDGAFIALLCLVPVVYIGAYSYFAWHGGQALNMRYLLPTLPFTSILTAYAWRDLNWNLARVWRRAACAAGAMVFGLYLIFGLGSRLTLTQQESVLLTVPLLIALAVLVLAGACLARGIKAGNSLRGATCVALAVGLAWASMVALAYDAPRAYLWRKRHVDLAREIAPRILPDSIVFVPDGGLFFGLLGKPQVRLATPSQDDYRDFRALVDYHLEAGRPVYLWLDPGFTATAEERGLLLALRSETLYEHRDGILVRVAAPRETALPPTPPS